MVKSICVFCSSSEDLAEGYYKTAEDLGELIAKANLRIIHGAGQIGLMGALMRSAAKYKCDIIGVVPERLNKANIVCGSNQKLVVTSDMKERKEFMRENSDAFIALPGGFGTLEELLEVITLKQLKYHTKPIVIINTYNFYDKMLEHFEVMYLQNFANPDYRNLYHVTNSAENAMQYITNYRPSNIYDKYLKE